MAPRRLVALMVGLLLISSVITALIPADKRDALDTTQPRSGREMAAPRLPSDGKLLTRTINSDSTERPVIAASVGDQLALKVTGSESETIVLEGLGGSSDVDSETPATFDVLLLDRGRFAIKTLGSDKVIGEIRVGQRSSGEQPKSSGPRGESKDGKKNHGGPLPEPSGASNV